MATQQIDGNAVTTTSTRNNGGAVVNAGTQSTLVDNITLGYTHAQVTGTGPIDGADTNEAVSAGTFAYDNASPIAKRVTSQLSGVSNTVLLSGADQPQLIRSIHKKETYRVSKRATAYRKGYWDPFYGKFSVYGTYARVSATVTVTAANHGLETNDYVYLDFTSGAATDGRFQVTVSDANTFTVTHGSTGSTSGNVTVVGPATATESPGTDDAASPTRSAPGELVFLSSGAVLDRSHDYKAKTG